MSSEKKLRLLTLNESVALVEGLTKFRIRKMCLQCEIKFYKFGNKYMIPEHELLKYFGKTE